MMIRWQPLIVGIPAVPKGHASKTDIVESGIFRGFNELVRLATPRVKWLDTWRQLLRDMREEVSLREEFTFEGSVWQLTARSYWDDDLSVNTARMNTTMWADIKKAKSQSGDILEV
jgi:hypothetical protein